MTKWVLLADDWLGDPAKGIEWFDKHSQGLVMLDKYIGSLLCSNKRFTNDPTFGTYITTYQQQCIAKKVSVRGRVIFFKVCARFRVDRNQASCINQLNLFSVPLKGFAYKEIQAFMDNVKLVLAHITPQELSGSGALMFQWLFRRFHNWRPIEQTVEKIRASREGSSKRTWRYLWRAIYLKVAYHTENENLDGLAKATVDGKVPGAVSGVLKDGRKDKNKDKDKKKNKDKEKDKSNAGGDASPKKKKTKKEKKKEKD